MPSTHTHGLREKLDTEGFVRLPRLVDDAHLDRLNLAVAQIQHLASKKTESSDDFVLEATGGGGWTAWQEGRPALAGVLRSASGIHRYVDEFRAVQESLALASGPVAEGAGARGSLVNAFLWAKPPRVGSAKPWHQDMAFAPADFDVSAHRVLTVWIALQEARAENGCLQFVAGSHRGGLLPHRGTPERRPGEPAPSQAVEPHVVVEGTAMEHRITAVPLARGSAVMFDGLVLHRSAPNTSAGLPRTAVSFVYQVPTSA